MKMKYKPWGQLLLLNLHECDKETLSNEKKLKDFCLELCKKLDTKPFRKPMIKRFGKDLLEGYSLVQFIETSSITIHVDESHNRLFLDIFSCKKFDSRLAEDFSKEFFKAIRIKGKLFYR